MIKSLILKLILTSKTIVTSFVFQDGDSKSFVLKLTLGPKYPLTELPAIGLDLFYNKHIIDSVKEKIRQVHIVVVFGFFSFKMLQFYTSGLDNRFISIKFYFELNSAVNDF